MNLGDEDMRRNLGKILAAAKDGRLSGFDH